jgi:N,N'-diacetyllegionaminate synthase
MTQPDVKFGHKSVSRDGSPLIMAEIGVNHDGSPDVALQLIAAAHEAGADAVKFQLFQADLLLAPNAELVDYQKTSAASAYELIKSLEMSSARMKPLIAEAHRLGMAVVVTPFSPALVQQAADIGADGIKLASPDLVNRPLIDLAIGTGLPLVLSTGAASMDEVARTIDWLGDVSDRAVFLHCVSSYPTPAEYATIGAITALRGKWPQMRVGYSDHTVETLSGGLAVAAGACMLEKHLTLDTSRPGPDHAASLPPEALAEYVRIARAAFVLRGPFNKEIQPIERQVRQQTRQSIVAARDLPAGIRLQAAHLTVKRPGTGIPAENMRDLIGQRLARAVAANTMLHSDDLTDSEES